MKEKTEFERGRGGAMIGGGLVYVGVVLAATTLFISFILTAFPEDAYFTRFVMVIAGLLVGGSMWAFPFALHNWAVAGLHRKVTIGLYYGEMFIIGLNTLVSFASLLAKYAGYELPEWVALYEPFTIISIVYTLAAWGTVFQLDPIADAKAKEHEALQKFREKVGKLKLDYLETVEGEEAIIAAANVDIMRDFTAVDPNAKRHFGKGREQEPPAPPILADQLFKRKDAEAVRYHGGCIECGQSVDDGGIYCSNACELASAERQAKRNLARAEALRGAQGATFQK